MDTKIPSENCKLEPEDTIPSSETEKSSAQFVEINKQTSDNGMPMFPGSDSNVEGSWAKLSEFVESYDAQQCEAWEKDIQNLWVFAGLFSATVTSFVLASYTSLQPDPADTTVQLLTQISSQLESIRTGGSSSVNTPSVQPFTVSASALRINAFWFVSLVLSLGTVVIGILGIQWLREYRKIDSMYSRKDAIAHKSLRYEAFGKWHVPTVLTFLPVIVQWSVILFFAGLIDFVWQLNLTVAIPVIVLVALVILILAVTSVLPVLQILFVLPRNSKTTQCPYKSPQSMAFRVFGIFVSWAMVSSIASFFQSYPEWRRWLELKSIFKDSSWKAYDMYWIKYRNKFNEDAIDDDRQQYLSLDHYHALTWLGESLFAPSEDLIKGICTCLWSLLHSDVIGAAGNSLGADIKRLKAVTDFLSGNPNFHPYLSLYLTDAIINVHNRILLKHHGARFDSLNWEGDERPWEYILICYFRQTVGYAELTQDHVQCLLGVLYSCVKVGPLPSHDCARGTWAVLLHRVAKKWGSAFMEDKFEAFNAELLQWLSMNTTASRTTDIRRCVEYAISLSDGIIHVPNKRTPMVASLLKDPQSGFRRHYSKFVTELNEALSASPEASGDLGEGLEAHWKRCVEKYGGAPLSPMNDKSEIPGGRTGKTTQMVKGASDEIFRIATAATILPGWRVSKRSPNVPFCEGDLESGISVSSRPDSYPRYTESAIPTPQAMPDGDGKARETTQPPKTLAPTSEALSIEPAPGYAGHSQ